MALGFIYNSFRRIIGSVKEVDDNNQFAPQMRPAEGITATFACLKILADGVAALPLHLYRRKSGDTRELATKHPLYRLLHSRPNPKMSAFRFRNVGQYHLASWGNSYCQIMRNGRGQIAQLWPMLPSKMNIQKDDEQNPIYIYDGKPIDADKILHIPGFGFDGVEGLSVIKLHAVSMGLADILEQFGVYYFEQGTHIGSTFKHPGRLSDKAFDRLQKSLDKKTGWGKSHKRLILEEGMEFAKTTIPPNDSQFIESRKFQTEEIARIFRIPPHMIQMLDKATFSNITQQSLDFVQNTLQPWLVLWEQELNRALLTEEEQEEYYFEHAVEGRLRGDTETRYKAYMTGRQWGWLSVNDIRRFENMNPIPGGDVYLTPLNMIPSDQITTFYAKRMSPKTRTVKPAQIEYRDVSAQVTTRDAIVDRFAPLIDAEIQRVINRQGIAIKRQVKKMVRDDTLSEFLTWLDKYYIEFEPIIARDVGPILMAMIELVLVETLKELNSEDDEISDEDIGRINKYVANYSNRHIGKSKADLVKAFDEAFQESTESAQAAVEATLDHWVDVRAETETANETVRGSSFAAQAAIFAMGLRAIWRTRGKSCPYCNTLDGKGIGGFNEHFAGDGDIILVDGEGELKVNGLKRHPPLHRGCDCVITYS